MSTEGHGASARRKRRIEEAILEVEGVVGVQVWQLPGRVEVGVRLSPSGSTSSVVARVREAAETLREDDEAWDVGVLSDAP